MTASSRRFDTVAVHGGAAADPTTGSRAVPIYQTVAYNFNDADHAADLFGLRAFGNIYSRIMNPTNDVLEQRIAALEGGSAALAVSSGHAAEVLGLLNVAGSGDSIVASTSLYGGTWNIFLHTFRRLGIEVRFVETTDTGGFAAASDATTKAWFVETIGNPRLDVPDIGGLAEAGRSLGIPLFVDNTFATPYLCRPIEHGAAVVIESLTKWIGGHGTSIGGILVDGGNFDWGTGRHPFFTEPDESYHGLKFWDVFGDFPGLVHFQHDLVGIPVAEEVHGRGHEKGEDHAGLAADGAAHGDQQQGEAGQQEGGFKSIHRIYLRVGLGPG